MADEQTHITGIMGEDTPRFCPNCGSGNPDRHLCADPWHHDYGCWTADTCVMDKRCPHHVGCVLVVGAESYEPVESAGVGRIIAHAVAKVASDADLELRTTWAAELIDWLNECVDCGRAHEERVDSNGYTTMASQDDGHHYASRRRVAMLNHVDPAALIREWADLP